MLDILAILSIAVSTMFIVGAIRTCMRIGYTSRYLSRTRFQPPLRPCERSSAPLLIVIPIYQEHREIAACARHFLEQMSPGMKLCFVFTRKEVAARRFSISRLRAGAAVVAEYRASFSGSEVESAMRSMGESGALSVQSCDRLAASPHTWEVPEFHEVMQRNADRIQTLMYSDTEGYMADQINHALTIIQRGGVKTAVVIYNADSRPEPGSLEMIREAAFATSFPRIVQQHSVYNLERSPGAGRFGTVLMEQARQWQDRWTVAYEIPRLLKTDQKQGGFFSALIAPFNYCVGHGVCLNPAALERLDHRIPHEYWNEDAALGYRAARLGIPIVPVARFDVGEVTSHCQVYIHQQSIWFNGPWQAWRYWLNEGESGLLDFAAALKLFLQAVYWLVGPVLWVSGIAMALMSIIRVGGATARIAIVVSFAAALLHGPIINHLVRRTIKAAKVAGWHGRETNVGAWCAFAAFYPMHMLGPLLRVLISASDAVRARVSRPVHRVKYKTERF